MPKGWLQNNESSVEDELEMSYLEYDDVKAAQHAYQAAVAEFESLQFEHKKYSRMLSPYVVQDGTPVDPIECARATAAWPDLKRQLALAVARKIETERALRKAVDAAQERVAHARIPARKRLVKALFAKLEQCVPLAEELAAFDAHTQALGAMPPETPFAELLKSWSSGGESKLDHQRRHLSEWLS